MADKLLFIKAQDTNPYSNLALEEHLLNGVKKGEVILYLWQNDKTVVIGRNQNCRAQCKVDLLAQNGGFLARRLSGGGAVYHDMGNLNFTFIAHEAEYDTAKQTQVILDAVNTFGIKAERTGRNDIEVDGRKFSGNAFFKAKERCLHHGTILISSDMAQLANYLNVSAEKLSGHGVKSVRSRVVNLSDVSDKINVASVEKALVTAFENVYGLPHSKITLSSCDADEVAKLTKKYADDSWRLGAQSDFTYSIKRKFAWGEAQLCLCVSGTNVSDVAFFTDSLDETLSDTVVSALLGCFFAKPSLCERLQGAKAAANTQKTAMLSDIIALVEDELS